MRFRRARRGATRRIRSFSRWPRRARAFYAASGDDGAYDDGFTIVVDDPASQPFVTGVGGTKLSVSGASGPYQSESAWGDPSEPGNRGGPHGSGGGGGVSQFTPIPDYQNGVGLSQTFRNVPDVSLAADP